jgi:hypothetical protein
VEQRDSRNARCLSGTQRTDQHRINQQHVGRLALELLVHVVGDVSAEPELLRHERHLGLKVEWLGGVVVGGVHERTETPAVVSATLVDRTVAEQPDVVSVPAEVSADAEGRHEIAGPVPSNHEYTHWTPLRTVFALHPVKL